MKTKTISAVSKTVLLVATLIVVGLFSSKAQEYAAGEQQLVSVAPAYSSVQEYLDARSKEIKKCGCSGLKIATQLLQEINTVQSNPSTTIHRNLSEQDIQDIKDYKKLILTRQLNEIQIAFTDPEEILHSTVPEATRIAELNKQKANAQQELDVLLNEQK